MAQTFRYFDELVGQFPDNTQGLIKSEDVRDLLVSTSLRVGILQDDDLIEAIPITDGVLTQLNPIMVSPTFAGQGWTTDGNNYLLAENSPDTVVPAGYTTLGRVTTSLSVQKSTAGTGSYSMHLTRDGVSIGPVTFLVDLSNTFINVAFEAFTFIDRSVTATTYGVAIQGEGGTNADVDILPLEISITDTILASEPA